MSSHSGLKYYLLLTFICGSILMSGCYSFKGTSIPPGVSSFNIAEVDNTVPRAPATIGQDFRDILIDKVRSESRLNLNEQNPDLIFNCKITQYDVTSVAPKPDETTAYNQLEITVNVSYIDNQNEDNNWTQNFSFFERFESSQNLSSVRDQLIDVIFTDIAEKVFNRAFTNW